MLYRDISIIYSIWNCNGEYAWHHMAASSHYVNQCWLLINEVLWHVPLSNFAASAQTILLFCGMSLKSIVFKLLPHLPRTNKLNSQCVHNVMIHTQRWIFYNISTPVHYNGDVIILLIIQFSTALFYWIFTTIRRLCNHRAVVTYAMMTSSNGKNFRFTGHLCEEFTGHRWIPRTKASDAELWCFLWSAPV